MANEAHYFVRPLGMSERFYWNFDTLACTNFSVMAEVAGDLPIDALKYAFFRAISRQLAYRLRVVAGPGHRLDYYAVSEQEAADGLDITVVENRTLDDVVVDEIDTSFASGSCPMVRCRILTAVPVGRTSIVFTFHHCMTDAPGAMALVQDLLVDSLYAESEDVASRLNPLTAETYTAGQEALYPGRYRGWRKFLSLAGLSGATVVDGLHTFGHRSLYNGQRSHLGRVIKSVELALDRGSTAVVLRTCRQEGVTVHGLICAGLLLALRDEMGAEKLVNDEKGLSATVVSAMNMRRWLAGGAVPDHVPGMFASMVPTNHFLSSETTPWTLARDVNRRLVAARDRGTAHLLWQAMPPAVLLPPNEKGARRIYKFAAGGPKGPIVTNIGKIDPIPELQDSRVAALSFAIGPGVNYPICAAVSSWAGRLFINCTYDQVVFEPTFMAPVMARLNDYLTIDSHLMPDES